MKLELLLYGRRCMGFDTNIEVICKGIKHSRHQEG